MEIFTAPSLFGGQNFPGEILSGGIHFGFGIGEIAIIRVEEYMESHEALEGRADVEDGGWKVD